LDAQTQVIISEIVAIVAEARAFILDGRVCDLALYEGDADRQGAEELATQSASTHRDLMPRAYVLDLAFAEVQGWFILEFNSAWGAGLNGCSAEKVLPCIEAATLSVT
jgi:hypothetical protein